MECGGKAAAVEFESKAVADATALEGAFGTVRVFQSKVLCFAQNDKGTALMKSIT